jgi:adenylosuccinate lyase
MIDRYTRPAMRALWSDARRFETWLNVELAACRAMEHEGWVPAGTADVVEQRAARRLDATRILTIEATVRHDVIAFLTHVEELAGSDARWLHLGMTSSDVLDTSLALLAREACDGLIAGLNRYRAALRQRAEEHRATPVVGRSHGVHAEPTSLGLVFLSFLTEATRARRRLVAAREGIAVGKIAGAVGNLAHLSPRLEERALAALELRPEAVATQVVARDRHAELLSALAFVGGALERFGLTVRHWQRTEVGEAEEAFERGQKGSSAMPHKKNPIAAENLCGAARLLRSYAQAGFEDIALWHERDISHSSVERVVMPDATTLADYALARASELAAGLVINPERMAANLELSQGLIYSEGVLLALVRKGLPRQRAYEAVQRAALRARAGQGTFPELLSAEDEISAVLDRAEVARCFDIQHNLRYVDALFERALADEDSTDSFAGFVVRGQS